MSAIVEPINDQMIRQAYEKIFRDITFKGFSYWVRPSAPDPAKYPDSICWAALELWNDGLLVREIAMIKGVSTWYVLTLVREGIKRQPLLGPRIYASRKAKVRLLRHKREVEAYGSRAPQ